MVTIVHECTYKHPRKCHWRAIGLIAWPVSTHERKLFITVEVRLNKTIGLRLVPIQIFWKYKGHKEK